MEHRLQERFLKHLMIAPFIYFLLLPFLILDFFVELYHYIAFPLYGYKKVNRSKYIIMDRYKLIYLTTFDKGNCTYCGYVNGLLRYITAIGAETEKYWCGIKHDKKNGHEIPKHQKNFLEYDNEKEYKKFISKK